MEESIVQTLIYFSTFQYPPTVEELYQYLTKPAQEIELNSRLTMLVAQGKLLLANGRVFLADRNYTGYSDRNADSEKLLQDSRSYIANLEYIPTLQLIGISGSLSMANGKYDDDIDIFIIASDGTVWITRFMVLVYKKVLSLINPTIGRKLCFNLFFSETGLKLQKERQTLYVAHEILQLKVLFNRKGIYHKFLSENNWVKDLFPNVQIKFQTEIIEKKQSRKDILISFFDSFIGNFQKMWLKAKGYIYYEWNGQLWLIQRDWNREMNKD
ncbi:hypothetical protein BH09PAT2_BH09PAT2_05680 [soil metagenome]